MGAISVQQQCLEGNNNAVSMWDEADYSACILMEVVISVKNLCHRNNCYYKELIKHANHKQRIP